MQKSIFSNEIIIQELMKNQVKAQRDLASFKRKMAKKYKIPCPSNIELLKAYHKLVKNKTLLRQGFGGQGNKKTLANLERLLRTRPIRSLSGIVNISVLTKPYPCPGKCLYCPIEKGIPKSYVSGEPAVERAKKLNYNPYLQVKKRVEMLELEGHPTDKIELRIVGGTWSYYPKQYQSWFIKQCFEACNTYREQCQYIRNNNTMVELSRMLRLAQKRNEKAKHRIVGLSVETRPDFITIEEIKRLRNLGVTMVELGVQSIYDNILKLNLRGHGNKETILATKLLKDAGFKVLYQIMLNLPGSNLKKDEEMFAQMYENPNFQPDLLKIYPCALLKEAPLYRLWKTGKYKPHTEKQLIGLVRRIKKKIPYYVRIQRITRDIPSGRIVEGGAKISNLRQILAEQMKKNGWQCKCIRCREVKEEYNPKEKIYLFRQDYLASDGKEIFLSFETKNRKKLYSLLRLRIPSQYYKPQVRSFFPALENSAIIREIHTYGQLVPLTERKLAPQHRGLGKKLVKEAEKIARNEFGLNKVVVISAVGARNYFRQLGYKLRGSYMIKVIKTKRAKNGPLNQETF